MQYTPIPNHLFTLSSELDPYSFKVLMYICRKTLGWHKDSDRISLSQLTSMTGISKSQVRRALVKLQEARLIACSETGNGKISSEYYLTDLITQKNVVWLPGRVSQWNTQGSPMEHHKRKIK